MTRRNSLPSPLKFARLQVRGRVSTSSVMYRELGRASSTTAGGDWLGTLDAAPAPDADGLTAQVPLTDTADLWGTVYFVKK